MSTEFDDFNGAGALTDLASWTTNTTWTQVAGSSGDISVRTDGSATVSVAAGVAFYSVPSVGGGSIDVIWRYLHWDGSHQTSAILIAGSDGSNALVARLVGTGASGLRVSEVNSGTFSDLYTRQGVQNSWYKLSWDPSTGVWSLYSGGTASTVGAFTLLHTSSGAENSTTYAANAGTVGVRSADNLAGGWLDYVSWTTAGGGGTSVTLGGVSATGNVGSLGATGAAAVTLTGLPATGEVGSFAITGAASITLAGQSATGRVGSLSIQTGNGITVNLTGVQGTGSVGDLSAIGGAVASISGVSAIGQVGSILAAGGAVVSLTGVNGLGLAGSLAATVSATIALSGLSANGLIGILEITGGAAVTLSGQMANGNVGSLTISTGLVSIALPSYRICTIEHEDRTFLVLAEDRTSVSQSEDRRILN